VDKVSTLIRDLGTPSFLLEKKFNQFESRLSNVESSNSLTNESLISYVLEDSLVHVYWLFLRGQNPMAVTYRRKINKLLVKSILDTLFLNLCQDAVSRLECKSD